MIQQILMVMEPAGGAPPSLPSDTFTDTNGTNLTAHTPNSGSGWTVHQGSFAIQGNKAQSGSGTSTATMDAGTADGTVSADVTDVTGAGNNAGLVLRFQDTSNYYLLWADAGGGTLVLYEIQAGTLTSKAAASMGIALDTPATISCVMSGNNFTGKVNGATAWSYAGSFLNNKTRHGIESRGTANLHDNFQVS